MPFFPCLETEEMPGDIEHAQSVDLHDLGILIGSIS
jgi:hypothetical protein